MGRYDSDDAMVLAFIIFYFYIFGERQIVSGFTAGAT
jgi:hypothetical protein